MSSLHVPAGAILHLAATEDGVVIYAEHPDIPDRVRLRPWEERASILKQVEEFLEAHDPATEKAF